VYENIAFSVRENFALPEEARSPHRVDEAARRRPARAQAMMPNDLSGGMTRRVALARAIATDPHFMNVRRAVRRPRSDLLHQIRLLIRTHEAIGLTSIVVTYDVHEALQVADYVYVINDGAVLGKGTRRKSRRPRIRT